MGANGGTRGDFYLHLFGHELLFCFEEHVELSFLVSNGDEQETVDQELSTYFDMIEKGCGNVRV